MKRIFSVFALAVVLSSPCVAETESVKVPTTKLESFASKNGVVVLKGYSEIGEITGTGVIVVDSKEFKAANDLHNINYGISIKVTGPGRLERTNTSYVDYDEIDSLIKGIEYVSKISKSATSMDNFEAIYRTKGNLEITSFNSKSDEISAAVASGVIGKTTVFIRLEDLDKLRQLISDAKAKLDQAKQARR